MLKFKIALQATQISCALLAEQVHGKFPLCVNICLNSCRDLHSFNFICRLFHKTLPLKFNEFIPYF